MIKKYIIPTILGIGLITSVGIGSFKRPEPVVTKFPEIAKAQDAFVQINLNERLQGAEKINALYANGSDSIKEMQKTSDHVVYGKALSVDPFSEVAMKVEFEIYEEISGKKINQEKIVLSQIKDEHVLEPGMEYLLFINEQPDADWYYVRTGHEGIFDKDKNGNLTPRAEVMKRDMKNVFKIKKDEEVKVNYKKFFNYLKQS